MTPRLTEQARRFVVSGIAVTVLHVILATAFIGLAVPPAYANGAAFLIATFLSYLINTLWSFSQSLASGSLRRFIVVSLAGCVIAVAVSGIADAFGLHYLIGIALVVCIVPPTTFFAHRYWTYK